MMYEENRWLQRYQNYQRALSHLDAALETIRRREVVDLSDLEKLGVVKYFELTFELAWKTLQDYFKEQGYLLEGGPRPVILQAAQDNLVLDGNDWIRMLASRNEASHAYDEEVAEEIIEAIVSTYYDLFDNLDRKLTSIKNAL